MPYLCNLELVVACVQVRFYSFQFLCSELAEEVQEVRCFWSCFQLCALWLLLITSAVFNGVL